MKTKNVGMNRRGFLKLLSLLPTAGVILGVPGSGAAFRAISGTVTVQMPPAELWLGRPITIRHLGWQSERLLVEVDGQKVEVPGKGQIRIS